VAVTKEVDNKQQNEKSNSIWIYIIGVVGLLLIAALFLSQNQGGGGGAGDVGSIPTTPTANVELNVPFDAATSPNLQTVSEAREFLYQRGFEGFGLLAFYDIRGYYLGAVQLEEDSTEKYPTYSAFIHSESTDTIFVVLINNGRLYARTPFESERYPDSIVLLAETDFITAYDSRLNTFEYLIPPDNEDVLVKTVPTINREFLDNLRAEELEL